VLGNDQDSDGDTLTISAFDALSVRGGAVAMSPNGGFTYTPAPTSTARTASPIRRPTAAADLPRQQ